MHEEGEISVFFKSNVESGIRFDRGHFQTTSLQIKYEADVQLLDIIDLADQGYGKSVIRTGGDLSFACQASSNAPPDVLSFADSAQSFITLPKWNSLSSGSLGESVRFTYARLGADVRCEQDVKVPLQHTVLFLQASSSAPPHRTV